MPFRFFIHIAIILSTLVLFPACNKDLSEVDQDFLEVNDDLPSLDVATSACRITEPWRIPDLSPDKLDLLFIIDDSESMYGERARLATAIYPFLKILDDRNIDYCTGIMLAHASEPRAGRFYASDQEHLVLCRREYSAYQIGGIISRRILRLGLSGSAGEAGLYALKEAVTTNLTENRELGFFRNDAGLAIVFMSDENDISESRDPGGCPDGPYQIEPRGESEFSNNCEEAAIRYKYYSSNEGFLKWGYNQVYREVKRMIADRPLFAAAITYQPMGKPPSGGEYGYGYNEFVEIIEPHSLIDIGIIDIGNKQNYVSRFLDFAVTMGNSLSGHHSHQLHLTPIPGTIVIENDLTIPVDKALIIQGKSIYIHPNYHPKPGTEWFISYEPISGCDRSFNPKPINSVPIKKGTG